MSTMVSDVLQGREKVLGSLRKELHIGNDAHAEIMDCVLNGKAPPRLAAAAAVRFVVPRFTAAGTQLRRLGLCVEQRLGTANTRRACAGCPCLQGGWSAAARGAARHGRGSAPPGRPCTCIPSARRHGGWRWRRRRHA